MKKLLFCTLLLILASCGEAPKPPKKKPREWTKENSYDMNEELAIREDLNLERHMADAVASLRICLAADESVRTGQPVRL